MSRTLPCPLCEHPDLHGPGVCSLVPLRAQGCFWRHPWKIPDAPTTCLSYSQMRSALPGCSQPLLSLDILPRISLKLNHFHGVAPCPALQCVSYIRQTGMVSRPPPGRVPAVSLRQLPYTFLGPHPSSSRAAPPRPVQDTLQGPSWDAGSQGLSLHSIPSCDASPPQILSGSAAFANPPASLSSHGELLNVMDDKTDSSSASP